MLIREEILLEFSNRTADNRFMTNLFWDESKHVYVTGIMRPYREEKTKPTLTMERYGNEFRVAKAKKSFRDWLAKYQPDQLELLFTSAFEFGPRQLEFQWKEKYE